MEAILKALKDGVSRLKTKKAFIGLDGFIDKISVAVDQRYGKGKQFNRLETVKSFAERVANATSKNTNIEWYLLDEKMGGNGPLLAYALLQSGLEVQYLGLLGEPIHPLFENFAKKTNAISLGQPGETHALEFKDGKILFGYTYPLEVVDYSKIVKSIGEETLLNFISCADVVGFQNWTMIPGMTNVISGVIENILPRLPKEKNKEWFFDLADPQKRPLGDLQLILGQLKSFEPYGDVSLSLNRSEAEKVGEALGLPFPATEPKMRFNWLKNIQEKIEIVCIILHYNEGSMGIIQNECGVAKSFKIDHPICLTGSGDHFNAGFLIGKLLNFKNEDCLLLGNAFAGDYIKMGKTPTLEEVQEFLKIYKDEA